MVFPDRTPEEKAVAGLLLQGKEQKPNDQCKDAAFLGKQSGQKTQSSASRGESPAFSAFEADQSKAQGSEAKKRGQGIGPPSHVTHGRGVQRVDGPEQCHGQCVAAFLGSRQEFCHQEIKRDRGRQMRVNAREMKSLGLEIPERVVGQKGESLKGPIEV